jgi:ribosomal-protein-alanine N-acetyltransferase
MSENRTEPNHIEFRNAFIVGTNIYLRPLDENDANGDYPSWLNDNDVCMGNSHHTFPNTKKATIEYISFVSSSRDAIVLAIVEKVTGRHVGNISLQDINLIYRSAEFAIIIGEKSSWGKGYGEEAGLLLMKHGFENLNLHRIYCGTFENNKGMQKLAEKLHMKSVGRQRQAAYKNGKYLDILQYDLLRTEFDVKKA